eukprot:scaffold2879_cov269-Prasinococcus_capsulatus_cf.AAC.11
MHAGIVKMSARPHSSKSIVLPITSPSLVCTKTVSASGAEALGLVALRSNPLRDAHSKSPSYKHLYLAEVGVSVFRATGT